MFDPARLPLERRDPPAAGRPAQRCCPDVGGSSEVLGRVTPDAARRHGTSRRARRWLAVARTTRAVRRASASSRLVTRSRAGAHPARCSRRRRSRSSIPGLRAHTFCHVVPGTWYVMGVVLSAGGAFAWYRDQLARELASARRMRTRCSTRKRRAFRPGADGVTFLPYLQGERTPHRDASARGAFLGLSLAHSRAHMTRAVARRHCVRAPRLAVDPPGARSVARTTCCSPAAARRARSFGACRLMCTECRSAR